MPAALAALHGDRLAPEAHHLLRVLERTDRGDAHDPGLAEAGNHRGIRPAPEADRAHPLGIGDDDLDDLARAGLEAMEIDPEAVRGEPRGLGNRGRQLARLHHRAREKPEGSRIAARRHQLRRGDPAHRGLDHRQAAAEQRSQRGGERVSHDQALPASRSLFFSAIDLPLKPAM